MQQCLKKIENIEISTFLNAFDNHVDPVVITDENIHGGVKIIYVNDAFCKETGYSKKEVIGKSPKILQGEKSDKETLLRLKKNLLKGKRFVGQTTNYRKDGSEYIVQWSVTPLKDKDGETVAFIALQKILTKLSTTNDDKLLLKAIIEHAPGMILVTDLEGVIVYANNSFVRNTGYNEEELIGKHSRLLKSGKQDKKFYEKMWSQLISTGKFNGLFISKKKDGTFFYDKKKITVIKDKRGDPRLYLAVSYNVTKDIQTHQTLKTKAYTDSLTGLYNKDRYLQDIKTMISQYHNTAKPFSLLIIDIDHFKKINDNLGHDVGDVVLKDLAKILKNSLRDDDKLYRWGGEEFALLMPSPINGALALAKKLNQMIKMHSFESTNITVSIGVAQIDRGLDSESLFRLADKALYQAKKEGRDRVIVCQ